MPLCDVLIGQGRVPRRVIWGLRGHEGWVWDCVGETGMPVPLLTVSASPPLWRLSAHGPHTPSSRDRQVRRVLSTTSDVGVVTHGTGGTGITTGDAVIAVLSEVTPPRRVPRWSGKLLIDLVWSVIF